MATMMLIPLASFCASADLLLPPIINPYVWTWCVISSLSTPNVCMASSLVGERMRTPVPRKQKDEHGKSQTNHHTNHCSRETWQKQPIQGLPFLGMNLSLTMSSTAGMRKARVLPLPVFAAARRSLNVNKGREERHSACSFSEHLLHSQQAQHRRFRLQG